MAKVFSVDKLWYETELRKRILIKGMIKGILKKNISLGVVPEHEEERWEKITKSPNHVIRMQLKVTTAKIARSPLTT